MAARWVSRNMKSWPTLRPLLESPTCAYQWDVVEGAGQTRLDFASSPHLLVHPDPQAGLEPDGTHTTDPSSLPPLVLIWPLRGGKGTALFAAVPKPLTRKPQDRLIGGLSVKLELLISKEEQFPAARTVPAVYVPSHAQV